MHNLLRTNTSDSSLVPFIDLGAQRRFLEGRIEAAIRRVIDHGKFILGPEVEELERQLSDFCGARHVVTCASGTDALALVLMAKGVGVGDAVMVPSFTFASTAEVVAALGAVPVFVDVLAHTFNIDPTSLATAVEGAKRAGLKPIAVIAVDLFGQPADYEALEPICDAHRLFVLCDAAQSFGANYRGRKVGTMGLATATSFFPSKPLGCYGDGGAVFTDDDDLAEVLRSLRVHGKGSDKYDNVRIGMNSRLDTIQAAILIEKLQVFDQEIEARERIAERYHGLAELVTIPEVISGATSTWAQYTIRTRNRDALSASLKRDGISSAIYYPRPLHRQSAFASFVEHSAELDVSEGLAKEVLSLPMHAYLDGSTQARIADVIGAHFARGALRGPATRLYSPNEKGLRESRSIVVVLGARPQFVKAAPVSRAIDRHNESGIEPIREIIVHTGQHFDYKMSGSFFAELRIPPAQYNLGINSVGHGAMTGRMLERIEELLLEIGPQLVLVYGDTNSTLAGALAAAKLQIPVAHVEAGLRSFDWSMPEEINRVLTDRVSTLLFCPSAVAENNLRAEGITSGIALTGDVMLDVMSEHREFARSSVPLARWALEEGRYAICTVHRAENTDDAGRLRSILEALGRIALEMPVILPLHPRTRKIVQCQGLEAALAPLAAVEPVSYLEMLRLVMSAAAVLTDSGGLQKEAFFLGVPCLTLRDATEWTETVDLGWNTLCGAGVEGIVSAWEGLESATRKEDQQPYGDGRAAEYILQCLVDVLTERARKR